jgi:hypothetical protein
MKMNPATMILEEEHILSVRRNHALEHATLNILNRRFPQYHLAGYSHTGGFWVFGEVPTSELRIAAEEALRRLNDGEENLAIHPHCGTNYVTMGIAAGAASWLAALGMKKDWRDRLDRLSLIVTVSTLAMIASQPLGPKVQRNITTAASLGALEIVEVEDISRGNRPIHRVSTRIN